MAETVVGRALLRILQRFVCFVDFFEFPFGIGIIRVFVRMVLHREFAEGAFQLFFVRSLADAECFVKVCFRHSVNKPRKWISGCTRQPDVLHKLSGDGKSRDYADFLSSLISS